MSEVLLSLVVPCFNEEASVERLHAAVTAAVAELSDVEIEVVYVDDGSSDGTLAALRRLAATDPAVRYTSLSRNFGKEAAMLAGLERATGEAVVIMDADLQHPPRLLPDMVALYRQGFDQVVARRDRRGDRLLRMLASRSFYRLVNWWVDVRLLDGAGDFRLLSRLAVDAVLAMPEYNRFSKGLFSWIGFRTVVVAHRNETRQAGHSRWTFGKLLNYAFDGLLSFNNRPLRLAIYGGLFLTLIAVVYMAWVVADAVSKGIDVPGYTTIIVSVIGLGGVQMTILGVVGEYIGRIYYETKRRPHYLVQETEHLVTQTGEAARSPAGPAVRTVERGRQGVAAREDPARRRARRAAGGPVADGPMGEGRER
ncbi:Glycosyltransferase involved in cell wall bisynthesis [Micromonospora citrea]|uniref:Glycosyltransferase involved in cell wall bisynthesis n=1 Tax=Micromonospora citrea TaxID=47855 RepID=A0A1C6VZW7_9ACTN|nr:glycosyltransferase family 2 protein [Micromonospora citrea]SCL71885.1 Glycosyltransferase involved in cell wall bisynthesis [Micromonospora citrea]